MATGSKKTTKRTTAKKRTVAAKATRKSAAKRVSSTKLKKVATSKRRATKKVASKTAPAAKKDPVKKAVSSTSAKKKPAAKKATVSKILLTHQQNVDKANQDFSKFLEKQMVTTSKQLDKTALKFEKAAGKVEALSTKAAELTAKVASKPTPALKNKLKTMHKDLAAAEKAMAILQKDLHEVTAEFETLENANSKLLAFAKETKAFEQSWKKSQAELKESATKKTKKKIIKVAAVEPIIVEKTHSMDIPVGADLTQKDPARQEVASNQEHQKVESVAEVAALATQEEAIFDYE